MENCDECSDNLGGRSSADERYRQWASEAVSLVEMLPRGVVPVLVMAGEAKGIAVVGPGPAPSCSDLN